MKIVITLELSGGSSEFDQRDAENLLRAASLFGFTLPNEEPGSAHPMAPHAHRVKAEVVQS